MRTRHCVTFCLTSRVFLGNEAECIHRKRLCCGTRYRFINLVDVTGLCFPLLHLFVIVLTSVQCLCMAGAIYCSVLDMTKLLCVDWLQIEWPTAKWVARSGNCDVCEGGGDRCCLIQRLKLISFAALLLTLIATRLKYVRIIPKLVLASAVLTTH